MSTRTKEKTLPHGNSAPRKASPNPSPSPSRPIGSKKSPNPSPSPSRPIGLKTKSPSSDKNVPSSLRSTKTRTSVDQPAVKKPVSAAASSEKPSPAKGRSLIKNQRHASPSTRTLQSSDPKEKALRTSSSFGGSRSTGTAAQKGASNRIVKTAPHDAVKKPARPSNLKKSSNVITKQNGEGSRRESLSSPVVSSPESLHDHEIVDDPHPQEDDHQSYVTDEEVSIDALNSHDYEVTADVVKEEEEEDQQTETPVEAKPDIDEQEDIKIVESATPEISDQLEVESSMKTEESEFRDNSTVEEQLEDNSTVEEQLEDNNTVEVNENLEVQVDDQGKEEVDEATEDTEKTEEVKEEDQVVREIAEVQNVVQPELVPQSEPELKTEENPTPTPAPAPAPAPEVTRTVAATHSTPVQAKKETSVVSNDTIEETASKLQEQRRNRVRALAGAFESVMQK